jgi:hypothetical protein
MSSTPKGDVKSSPLNRKGLGVHRALQRWEILPDPVLPWKWMRVWFRIEKAGEDALYRKASGTDPD